MRHWLAQVAMQAGRVVVFTSYEFNDAEKRYATGSDGSDLRFARWRCHLEGAKEVVLVTDHHPLTYLQSARVQQTLQSLSAATPHTTPLTCVMVSCPAAQRMVQALPLLLQSLVCALRSLLSLLWRVCLVQAQPLC